MHRSTPPPPHTGWLRSASLGMHKKVYEELNKNWPSVSISLLAVVVVVLPGLPRLACHEIERRVSKVILLGRKLVHFFTL